MQSEKIINIKEVEQLTSLSESTIKRLIKRGVFPQSIKLSKRRKGWRKSDIHTWMKEVSKGGKNGI